MSANRPADYPQRKQCLDPARSFSVRAPAGSGKTELLTQRVLQLLSRVQKPEEILCITFTRKAAAEMLERLLERLREAASQPRPQNEHQLQSWELAREALAQDRQQQWHLLDNPSRLKILTIDGLCARLTKNLPTLSQFGAQPEIAQDPYPLYQQAFRRLLEELENEGPTADALETLLSHLDNQVEQVEQLLISLLARRDQWLGFIGTGEAIRGARQRLEQSLSHLLQEELEALQQQLAPHASDLCLLADYAAANLQQEAPDSPLVPCLGITQLPATDGSDLPRWCGLAELLLTQKGEWRRKVDKRCGFVAGGSKSEKEEAKARKQALADLIAALDEIPGLLARIQRLRLLPLDAYSDPQWRLLDALTTLLPNLAARLLLSFADQGCVDYPQITQAALTALGDDEDPTDLTLMLDYQIRHILVDEFQDTATPQIRLLEKLTRGWEPGDGRSLFIVGDGMQSCYGFRDANVGLFLDARRHGIGDVAMTPVDLSVNFRSRPEVVDWVNLVFSQAFPAEDDISRGAVSYEYSQAFKPAQAQPAVEIDLFVGADDRLAEACRVRERVEQALKDNPEGSVAVLVRNRSHLREILPELRQAGLRWQATDLDPLATRMWVVDLVSLLRALQNPADRIAWLAILRAPWCGLDNQDLLTVAGDAEHSCLWSRLRDFPQLPLSDAGRQRVERLVTVMEACEQHRRRKSLRDTLESCWLALGGAACLQSESQLQDIEQLLSLVQQHDRGGLLDDQAQFQRDLEKLFAAPDSEADPRLQVMTIHKSKGLEFDTVILAGLDRPPRGDDRQLLLWQQRLTRDGREDLLLGPLSATGEEDDPLYQYLKHEQALKNQMEGTRLLYVGATRAISRLHLLGHLNLDSRSGEPRAPARQSLLASIWPYVKDQANIIDAQSPATELQSVSLRQLQRLPGQFQPPAFEDEGLLPRERSFQGDTGEDNLPQFSWRDHQRHIGTLTHRLLRQMVLHPRHWQDPTRFETHHRAWQQQLQQLGIPPEQCPAAVRQVEQLLRRVMADPHGQWIINPHHQHSACELALSYYNGFQTLQLVVDRSFVDEQGVRWIIDYKTAAPAAGQSFEAFIAQERERYRRQLQRYALAFAAMENRSQKAALYFPACAHLEPVPL